MGSVTAIDEGKPLKKSDPGDHVLHVMKTLGVRRTPKNYEVFYTAIVDNNKAIADKLKQFGKDPKQADLDALYEEFLDKTAAAHEAAKVLNKTRKEIADIISILHNEQKEMSKYATVIGKAGGRLGDPSNGAEERLKKVIDEIQTATNEAIARTGQAKKSMSEKGEEIKTLRKKVDRYREMALSDQLTGLKNRRAFDETMETAFKQKYDRTKVGLIIADIDHFKNINDEYGHPVGDKVLKYVSGIFNAELKGKAGLVARTGGEEFSFIIPGKSQKEVEEIANSIRHKLSQQDVMESDTGVNLGRVTVSMGVSMMSDASNPIEFYKNTDEALYEAKRAGRDRVVSYKRVKEIPAAEQKKDTWCSANRRRRR